MNPRQTSVLAIVAALIDADSSAVVMDYLGIDLPHFEVADERPFLGRPCYRGRLVHLSEAPRLADAETKRVMDKNRLVVYFDADHKTAGIARAD